MTNISQIMKQAKAMQEKMAEVQKKVEETEVEGSSGGGAVKITINGKHIVKKVSIDPKLVDKEEIEVLEDLIVAAFNDGKEKIQRKIADEMSAVTGGLQLPPGFKMPF